MTAAVKLPFLACAKHRVGKVLSHLQIFILTCQAIITPLFIPYKPPKFSAHFAIPKFLMHRLI